MAIQSVGGADATDLGGVAQATPGSAEVLAAGSETVQPVVTGERPAWLPEGFNSPEELAKAWDERNNTTPAATEEKAAEGAEEKPPADDLEVKPPEELPTDKPFTEWTPEQQETKRTEIRAALKEEGGFYADPRYEAAALEFETTGDVSPATIEATAAAFGVPVDLAAKFIQDQKDLRAAAATKVTTDAEAEGRANADRTAEIVTVVGTMEEYTAFQKWGETNLNAAEQAAYDSALKLADQGDLAPAKALAALYSARYKAEGNGTPARDVVREGGPSGGGPSVVSGFASSAEMVAAMSDRRYEQDEAYRNSVVARVAVSKFS